MKRLLSVLLAISLLSLPAGASGAAPRQPYSWSRIWLSMTESLPTLAEKLKDPESVARANDALGKVNDLNEVWSGNNGLIDRDYLMEMTLEAYLLQEAAASMSNDKAKAVLKEISSDLSVKLNHCQHNPKGMGSYVNVKVRTLSSSGTSQVGWQVFHVLAGPKIFLGEPGKPLQKLSTPAEGRVSVGNNILWAEKNGIRSKEQTFAVGFGPDDQDIDIPVP